MEEEGVPGEKEAEEKKTLQILEAKQVYILMSKDHRISRNRRAEWFFSRFGCLVTLLKDAEITSVGESVDFHVVSAIPKNPPPEWTPQRRHCYQYKITTNTVVTYLSRRYRIVYCIDVSPSVAAVDVQAGTVVFDRIFQSMKCSLDGLMRPFVIPGSTAVFQPKIFITVITHSPFVATVDDEVILQGKLLGPSTYNDILGKCFDRLNIIENKMAEMASTLLYDLDSSINSAHRLPSTLEGPVAVSKTSIAISSDRSLVDLLKQALTGLSLLPENSSSGLVILTDGVISVPDGRYLDNILSQLRYNTVSCSFIQLSSAFHPHLCHSALPYADLMRFVASATCGAFLSEAPDVAHTSVTEMNVYHTAFLAWSFQNSDSSQIDYPAHAVAKPGEWSIRNKCFFSVRDMPIVKKQQYSYTLDVDYMKVLSCRLREGFMIKNIQQCGDGEYEIVLSLPWKFLIHLEYVILTIKSPEAKVECILHLEGPYDFLHDVTCLAGRAFSSFYRQLMVNRFWATRKSLAESDRLLVHLNSFSSNPAYYSIPDSLRNGVPLFYFSPNSSIPILQSSDFPYPQFAQFWKPVCMLDTTVWQKWMHTHRIGIILEHDHPLPKHLHFPNSTGRFHIVQCRQAVMALNTLLKNMSSFVLVENHSYVKLMYEGENTTPFSFYIIRVTSKPPYVVLRLAFLVGTPGNLRHKAVSDLRQKISELTFPQRLKEPPRWRFTNSIHSNNAIEQSTKTTWSEMLCCILVQKPIEKILIRYEKVPDNFCEVLMPQHPFESPADPKSFGLKQSTFGFRPTHPNSLTSTSVMVPEMFNTVARYLHIKRWIWWFPKAVLVNFGLREAAEIVSTITKMRLQEGFRFACSSGGTITMILEVQMENETCRSVQELSESVEQPTSSQKYNTPCVVQFVVFPPCTSLTVNYEGDDEAYEDSEDLYFVTECWSEPQCGKISACPFRLLNGLEFSDVPSKVFEVNQECFLTLGTFEYLRGATDIQSRVAQKIEEQRKSAIQRGLSITEKNIQLIPFEFDLERILPKCQQAEIFFSMFFQDLSVAFVLEKEDHFVPFHERANGILYNTWTSNLAEVHDKEIKLELKHYEGILRMIISRDEEISKQYSEFQKVLSEKVPAWRCFVRAVDTSQIFITLIPRTLRDTKELFLCLEKSRCFQNLPDPNSQFDNLYNAFNSEESMDCLLKPKTRSRKISEPNCSHKPASASLAASLALEVAFSNGLRKRVRAFSGGESASVLKKALNIRSKLEEITTHQVIDESLLKYIVPKDQREIIVEDFANEDLCVASEDSLISETSPVHGNHIKVVSDDLNCTDNLNTSNSSSHSVIGSLSLPVYMYSCSLSGLKDHLILKGSSEVLDSFLDFRIFRVEGECERFFGLCNEMESPSRSSDCASQETKASAHGSSDIQKISIEEYCKELQLAYKIAYVRSVFECLQSGYHVGTEDLKALINFCHKDIVPIDITEFIKCVSVGSSSEETEKPGVERIPDFIQRKFREIICEDFQHVDPSVNLLYFKMSPTVKQEHYTKIDLEEISLEKGPDNFESASLEDQYCSSGIHSKMPEMADGHRRSSEDIQRASAFPLFMYIVCTFESGTEKQSVMISDLPLSFDAAGFDNIKQIIDESESEDKWTMKLELVLLSSPAKEPTQKNTSVFSPTYDEKIYRDDDSTCFSRSTQSWSKLPANQETAVKTAVNEIQWLLDDEITSFRSKSNTLTVDMLKSIAEHVEKSTGKLGCFQQVIPLKFVQDSREKAFNNFVERFNSLTLSGYCLRKLENWWFLTYEENDSPGEPLTVESSENKDLNLNSLQDLPSSEQEASSLLEMSQLSDFSDDNYTSATVFPFWMIFQVEVGHVISYSHCRYNEKDLDPLKRCRDTRDLMLNAISGLIRTVNQDLLLQSLHDTRLCSPLLEPENTHEPNEDYLPGMTIFDSTTRAESDFEGYSSHTRPGMFSCDVVWATRFVLHSRLRSGPGKSAFSRGVQILRSTLIALEVTNRENMFVYRNSNGDVFYLRLYRIYDDMEGMEYDINSENPSPRSSVSAKSRAHELAERISKDETLLNLRETSAPRDGGSEGIILLKVHGITEAGTEIKEQLIASLKNKLDDAILDVLSITLDRNPHCKLTPEDVHFIQKPNSLPDAIFKFSTRKFTRLLLPAFAYYLHQNLLQFLNIPKYTRPEVEFHFQDYFQRQNNFASEDQNVYLYNQNPGETGSRGVACVSASLVDKAGAQIRSTDWKRPADLFFSAGIDKLAALIETEEVVHDKQASDVMIQLCVWKQGRVNLDILKNMFCSAIKYAGWDLAMEYQILTPPLILTDTVEFSSELGEVHGSRRTQSSAGEIPGRSGRRRNSSSISTKEIRSNSKDQPRNRSLSFTMRRDGSHALEKPRYRKGSSPNSPNLKRGGKSYDSVRNAEFLSSKRTKVDRYEHLHPHYATLLKRWCSIGSKLNAPSLRVVNFDFKQSHYLDETLMELGKIINSVAPDNSIFQFWKLQEVTREFLAIGEKIRPDCSDLVKRIKKEVSSFKAHEADLNCLEMQDEAEYPENILELFKTKENFEPSRPKDLCILVARNVHQWRNCGSSHVLDPTYSSSEVCQNMLKFPPLISDSNFPKDDRSSYSLDRSRCNVSKGLLSLLEEASSDCSSILIPRQKFFMATVTKSSVEIILYNWSKESSDRLVEQSKLLSQWAHARMQLLSSVLLQKSGLFYLQPFFSSSQPSESSEQSFGVPDVRDLVLNSTPVKGSILDRFAGRKLSFSKTTAQLNDLYRNLYHVHTQKLSDDILSTPVKTHGEQTLCLLNSGKKEIENALFRYWLSRGPSASNVIGIEAIEAFKQAARTIHYCMTPIMFYPRWRNEVALTRDSTFGIYKRRRPSNEKAQQDVLRSRHVSEVSAQSRGSKKSRNVMWSIWRRSHHLLGSQDDESVMHMTMQSLLNSSKKTEEPWHVSLCNIFIQEYMQYLQTLGYIPTHSNTGSLKQKQNLLTSETWKESYAGRMDRVRRMSDGSVLSADSDRTSLKSYISAKSDNVSSRSKEKMESEDRTFYLQKSLPGGIILLEVGLSEPFFYCKIHALEAHRIQQNASYKRSTSLQSSQEFINECDKMKVAMHLHSFAYDFHLRCLHSYVSGRQLIFKQGYHITKFLEDFINYYCKGPNFARNTIHFGIINMPEITIPANILFDYILSHEKSYEMKVIRMNQLNSNKPVENIDTVATNDFVLVYTLHKKVAYKESGEESHYEEFDIALITSNDTTPPEGSIYSPNLHIKYYILLTSRRELYPKIFGEANGSSGKFYPVSVPEPLSSNQYHKLSRQHSVQLSSSFGTNSNISDITLTSSPTTASLLKDFRSSHDGHKPEKSIHGIREEKVLYMGYFSNHEQMMQQIVTEQSEWAEKFVHKIISKAAVDCRRDLLWQRLLVSEKLLEKPKVPKDPKVVRETVGSLTFQEFSELLELVFVEPIQAMDSRVQTLLKYPTPLFQNLIKVLASEDEQYQYKYFVSPDQSIHRLAIMNPEVYKTVILIEMNSRKFSCSLQIVFKEAQEKRFDTFAPSQLVPQIRKLVEIVISACCYCDWTNFI